MLSIERNTKQIIVIRRDLNMRKGKIAAQAAHASMSFLTRGICYWEHTLVAGPFNLEETKHWLENSFRKIAVYVNSDEELFAIHNAAQEKGLCSHLITDNGATEFNGVPTKTCVAIGPHWDEAFVDITDHLPLL